MKRNQLFVMPVALMFVVLATQAQASIVNVDLEGYRTAGGGNNGNPDITFIGTGAAGGGTVFNGVTHLAVSDGTNSPTTGDMQTISGNALLDSTGTATPVSVIATPVGLDNESNTAANTPGALFGDYIFNNSAGQSGNATVTIGGLFPGHTYNLYLYTGNTLSVSDGTSVAFTPVGIFDGSNTKAFSVTPTSRLIVVTLGGGTNVFSGFTIEGTFIPEPSSFVLCGLGAVGLIAAARRRRKS